MVAKQASRTTEHLLAKGITRLVADSLDELLHCTYEKVHTGNRSVFYSIVKQIHFDLLHEKLMDQSLNKHIAEYFDTSETAEKAGEKLLSANAFTAAVAALIPCRSSKAVAADRIATDMEQQLRLRTVDPDAKRIMRKSVSPPSRTDSAPSFSSSDKDYEG